MKTLFRSKEDIVLINQDAVSHYIVEGKSLHNAIWDSYYSKDKNLYLSLCSELTTSEYAQLAKFENDKLELLFETKSIIFPNNHQIRDSKIHTAIDEMEDGRLIMITHTTDKAPDHPAWMPEANYANPWEGYPGSSLLIYNPQNNTVENKGIPVQRESIYGAKYDPIEKQYYMLGYIKGHLYRYDLRDGQVYDMGKQVECASYRMVQDLEGNIYFSTRNGKLKKIDVRSKEVMDLEISLPRENEQKPSYLTSALCDPDGKIILAGQYSNQLSLYSPSQNKLEVLGQYTHFSKWMAGYQMSQYIGGMDFDSEGALWYIVCNVRFDDGEDFLPPSLLMKWDYLHGAQPEFKGVLGTKERTISRAAHIHIDDEKDLLYIPGTNHADDGISVLCVDLNKIDDKHPKIISEDPIVWPHNKAYQEHGTQLFKHWDVLKENPFHISAKIEIIYPHFNQKEQVESLVYSQGLIINTADKSWRVGKNGLTQVERLIPKKYELAPSNTYYAGRQYRSKSSYKVPMSEGYALISEDGVIERITDDLQMSFGTLSTFAKVRDIIYDDYSDSLYMLMGHDDDLSKLIMFNDKVGIRDLGAPKHDSVAFGTHFHAQLNHLALDKIQRTLYIGSEDNLFTLYKVKI